MKKIYTLLFVWVVVGALLSCGDDDDGVMERPDNTTINYEMAINDWLLLYYNVEVTYQDVHGVEHTERVDQQNWHFKEKESGELKNFYFKGVATARGTFPILHDTIKSITYSCDYRADYYTKKTSAKSIHKTSLYTTVKKENIETFIGSHPTIQLFECQYKDLYATE